MNIFLGYLMIGIMLDFLIDTTCHIIGKSFLINWPGFSLKQSLVNVIFWPVVVTGIAFVLLKLMSAQKELKRCIKQISPERQKIIEENKEYFTTFIDSLPKDHRVKNFQDMIRIFLEEVDSFNKKDKAKNKTKKVKIWEE